MNNCKVTFEFEFEKVNDSFMNCTVNGTEVNPDNKGNATIVLDITLPCSVQLQYSNKGPEDTIVDEAGEIVADKCIKINEIKLDEFNLNEVYLFQRIKLIDLSGIEHEGSYIGFNGIMNIDFQEDNVFKQYAVCNNTLQEE